MCLDGVGRRAGGSLPSPFQFLTLQACRTCKGMVS